MSADKYGFIYIWYDRKYKRYYIGCHWGKEDDGYICSSSWMKKSYKLREQDFRRKILVSNIETRQQMFVEEQRWLDMIKPHEIKPVNDKPRYYNLNIKNNAVWHKYEEHIKTVGQKISASKKGKKTGPRDPSIGKAISKAKKESFAKRETELGYKFTSEHRKNMSISQTGKTHTDEWKKEQSERLREQWNNGQRAAYGTMSDDHKKKISSALTGLIRHDVTNYKKAHSKTYLITMMSGETLEISGLKKYATDNGIPYVTLSAASQKGTSVAKYGILSVERLKV